MATQYQIFCRYLNETVNRTLTNQTTSEWISATEFKSLKEYYKANKDTYNKLCNYLFLVTKRLNSFCLLSHKFCLCDFLLLIVHYNILG